MAEPMVVEPPYGGFDFNKFIDRVMKGNSGRVLQMAILDVVDRSEIASANVTLYQDEVDFFIDTAVSKTMHNRIVSFGYDEYVVTSIQGHSFYCRSVNTTDPGGMCIIETPKFVMLSTYKTGKNNGFAGQVIPYIIEKAQEIVKL